MKRTLSELRKDTPGCTSRVHLNNAGTALTPGPVQQILLDYLELEQTIGGYEAELCRASELEAVYSSLARLVGAAPEEMAVTQNATRAWDLVFFALDLREGDVILTCRAEYASNYIAFLQRARRDGVEIRVLENDSHGAVCLTSLKRNLTRRVKLVALNHIPTNGGLVQPAAEIGAMVEDHPAFYLLDACQSVGQIPIDVKELKCDALTATSRKYLRGPRGVGFLYLADRHRELEPPFLDLHAATWTEDDSYRMRDDARRFETYEIFVGGKLAMGAAAEYAMEVGIREGWERLRSLAEKARVKLAGLPGVRVRDQGAMRGGIVTFTVQGWNPGEVRERLHRRGINVWTSTVRSARLDMEARGLEELVRASFHYYNTEEEVDRLVEAIIELGERAKPV